jgi:predicted transcriptional regulator
MSDENRLFAYDRSLTLIVVNAGHGLEILEFLLREYSQRYSDIYARHALKNPHTSGEAEQYAKGKAQRYAMRLYDDAVEFVKHHPADDQNGTSLKLVEQLAGLEALSCWKGQKGLTDIAVLRALHQVGMEAGSRVFSASSRQLAERAGRTRVTVEKSLRRLEATGHIKLGKKASGQDASTYELAEVMPLESASPIRGAGSGIVSRTEALPDVFRSLGQSAFRVWRALDDVDSATIADTQQATGLSRKTVEEALLRLLSAGLALDVEAGCWVRRDDDLNDLAVSIGADGQAQAQRERHLQERARWHSVIGNASPFDGVNMPEHIRRTAQANGLDESYVAWALQQWSSFQARRGYMNQLDYVEWHRANDVLLGLCRRPGCDGDETPCEECAPSKSRTVCYRPTFPHHQSRHEMAAR